MNIIIEGQNAVGKSTIADWIKAKYNHKIYHCTSKTKNDFNFHKYLIKKVDKVYDRFFMGELIYPELYKRKSKLIYDEAKELYKLVKDYKCLMLVLYSSKSEIIESRLKNRGEFEDIKNIESEKDAFINLSNQLTTGDYYENYHLIDISEKDAYKKIKDIIDDYMEMQFNDFDFVYRRICNDLYENGKPVGNTLELNNYQFTLNNPMRSTIKLKSRNLSTTYVVGELMWYWSMRNDVEFIGKFANKWKDISDDGKTNNSAYGYIIAKKHGFNQLSKIIDLLKKDLSSRRAVINLNVPNPNVIETKDEICTIALQFIVRENKLNLTAIMRSNDVWFGLPYDIIFFTQLQKYVAQTLGIEIGTYTHFATSMHLYITDLEKIERVAKGNMEQTNMIINYGELLDHITFSNLKDYVDSDFTTKKDFNDLLISRNILIKDNLHEQI